MDGSELGIAGVTVKLFDGSGTMLATTVTDASGYYLFPGLAAGSYGVQFLFPAGYEVSPLNAAAATLDSDAGANGFTVSIVLASGALQEPGPCNCLPSGPVRLPATPV